MRSFITALALWASALKLPMPHLFFNLNGGLMSMYKVVDVYGKEAVVQVDEYNRGDVLRKACTEMYGNWNVDMMLHHYRITPVR